MNKYKVSGFRSVRDKERFCLELTHDIHIKRQEMRGLTFESEKEIGNLMDGKETGDGSLSPSTSLY